LAIAAAALVGLIHSVSKPLLSGTGPTISEINPVTLAAIIYIINGLFFTPLGKKNNSVSNIGKKNWIILAIIGITETAALITYFFGLKESTAVNASILSNGEIVFSILVAITIFREKLKKKELGPFLMIIVGIILLPIGYDLYQNGAILTELVYGNLLILFSGVFYAIDVNLCKIIAHRLDAKKTIQLASFIGGGFALCLLFAFQIPIDVSLSQIPRIAIIGLFGTGVATFFFLIALKLIGTIRAVLLYSTTTVFGMIFASLFLQESIAIQNVFSIILVSVGIYMLRNRLGKSDILGKHIEENVKNE
jgi:drug/metabolite transporter (DMT)-like permease